MAADSFMSDFEEPIPKGIKSRPTGVVKSKRQAKAIVMSYLNKEVKIGSGKKISPRKTITSK